MFQRSLPQAPPFLSYVPGAGHVIGAPLLPLLLPPPLLLPLPPVELLVAPPDEVLEPPELEPPPLDPPLLAVLPLLLPLDPPEDPPEESPRLAPPPPSSEDVSHGLPDVLEQATRAAPDARSVAERSRRASR
jgi:hypothetical protein